MIRALFLSITLGITALLPFSPSIATAGEAQTVTLDVPGMTCAVCPARSERRYPKCRASLKPNQTMPARRRL